MVRMLGVTGRDSFGWKDNLEVCFLFQKKTMAPSPSFGNQTQRKRIDRKERPVLASKRKMKICFMWQNAMIRSRDSSVSKKSPTSFATPFLSTPSFHERKNILK
mmetsp:Transcript_39672/g.101913  ORF Transcript_39672/g.101913 Transcript_39672/m.101913 type:complete len:104 (+) Transcript_39672:1096-1407(+)